MRRLPPLAAFALVLAVLAAAGLLSRRDATADGSGPRMALRVPTGATCDAPADPSACMVPPGGSFQLVVDVVEGPAPGYVAFQTDIRYGSLTYVPESAETELVWPGGGGLEARFPSLPNGGEGFVFHGDASSLFPPFPASMDNGPVVELHLACPPVGASHELALLPYTESTPFGAGFAASDGSGGLGPNAPAKTGGQRSIDVDGDTTPELVDIADAVTINCSGPTATPTPLGSPTATPTRTPTPTGPAVPVGDASCNLVVDAIDAALVLQDVASLIPSVPCPGAADANQDGSVNVLDATLILQFVAGLLDELPPS
jgi:hypothetical protein